MFTGLAYLCVSITLPLVLFWISKGSSGHDSADGINTYRYPRRMASFFLGATLIVPLMCGIVVSTFPRGHPTGVEWFWVLAFFVPFAGAMAVGYLSVRAFRIDIDRDNIKVSKLVSVSVVPIASIRQVNHVVLQQAQVLSVYGDGREVLLKVSSSMQDFEGLALDIQHLTRNRGVLLGFKGDSWKFAANTLPLHWAAVSGRPWFDKSQT